MTLHFPTSLNPSKDALFLDVDGTLIGFADHPDQVHVPEKAIATLQATSKQLSGALALVSGRTARDLDRLLAQGSLPVAGLHGLEWRDPGATELEVRYPDQSILTSLHNAGKTEAAALGLMVECKSSGLAIHYRQKIEAGANAASLGESLANRFPVMEVLKGNHVVELRPKGTGKGDAVRHFMAHPVFRGRNPIFVGDDVTDEDGFQAAEALGGIGIVVGDRRPTLATQCLPSIADVWNWLDRVR